MLTFASRLSLPVVAALALGACTSTYDSVGDGAKPTPVTDEVALEEAPAFATIGKRAPDFTLRDLNGKEFKLSAHTGKTVVLEWFNPGCPWVVKAHTEDVLADYPAKAAKDGIVWVAINSGAPGKQGADKEQNVKMAKEWKMAYPVLLDPTGEVGMKYKARTTPHMFVIDPRGVLIYDGALTNDPRKQLEPDERVNYVAQAIAEHKRGAVKTPKTKPYGCSVKYDKK